jgi:hypothetical protein
VQTRRYCAAALRDAPDSLELRIGLARTLVASGRARAALGVLGQVRLFTFSSLLVLLLAIIESIRIQIDSVRTAATMFRLPELHSRRTQRQPAAPRPATCAFTSKQVHSSHSKWLHFIRPLL